MKSRKYQMKKDKLHTILLLIAIIMMAISFVCVYNKTPEVIEKRDTTIVRDTIWKDTTIYEKQLVPKKIVETKHDTVFTPNGDSLILVTEKKTFEKSIKMGLDTVDAQIVTEGINTSLESLKMRLRLHRVNTTETVEVIRYVEKKKKWFHIQPQATFGYDPLNKNWGAVIGIGIGVDI